MSTLQPTMADLTKRLVTIKLLSNRPVIFQLMILQGLGFLFSLTSMSGGGGGGSFIYFSYSQYSGAMILIFTMLWMFITALTLTMKREDSNDHSFAVTRDTQGFAHGILLLIYAGVGALTALLLHFPLVLVYRHLLHQGELLIMTPVAPTDYMIGFLGAWLYLILVGGFAYLFGTMSRQHVFLRLGVFAAIAAFLFTPLNQMTEELFFWFISEEMILIFAVKVFISFAICFGIAFGFLRQMEVIR